MLVQLVSLFALAASSLATPVQDVAAATSLGYLRCTSEGQIIGYISKSLNSGGVYKGVSPDSDSNDVNHRILVSLDQSANGTQSMLVRNAPNNNYPFLGGIEGEDGANIGKDGDYLTIGGTGSTSSGAIPSYCGNTYTDATNRLRKCESAIWVFNPATSEVSPQWTNDDGTVVAANVGYVDKYFVITGNKTEFENTWSDNVEWITLNFET